jgi:putative RecB family exonuclease
MRGMEQLGFDGMPRRLYTAYPSRLTTWLDCPRRFRMAYLDRPPPRKGPPWAHNSLGASIHLALAAWWRLPLQQRSPMEAIKLLKAIWLEDGYRDAGQSAALRVRAAEMVAKYVSGLDPAHEPIGIERVVATRTEVVALSGRVDRIDQRGDELVVVDYKTGRHALTADDARGSLALAAYALATQRTLHRRCRRVELHHLPTGTVVEWTYGDGALERHLGRIEDIAAECRDAEEAFTGGLEGAEVDRVFPPRVGPQCAWCDFARACPEGALAFPTKQSWAGLPDC